ncbi:MAG: histidinol-phosphatase HisJ family protein [Bacillota bacterium]|nr:histidinol-phosphatase HisJ family protein [Bacillota bacterium]
MKLCDMHVHSNFSADGLENMETMCLEAVKKKIDCMAFTEHWEVSPSPTGESYYIKREDDRTREYKRVTDKFGGKLQILFGIELGQPHHNPKQAENLILNGGFDFILGSLHIYRSSDGKYRDVYYVNYNEIKPDIMFIDYFKDLFSMVSYGGFDVIAHLDYPLRVLEGYIDQPTVKDYMDLIDFILKKAVDKGIGIEIGTRGLSDWQKRVGPENFVLKRYRELGGEIVTTGSDSHVKGQLGFGLAEACNAARKAGFSHIAYYKNRKPVFAEIGE